MSKAFYRNRGFTLIELLVVIGIIGILAGGLLIMINPGAQMAKARDAARKSDLQQLNNAIKRYYVANGSYPSTGSEWWGASAFGGHGTGATGYIPGLVPSEIDILPVDPKGATACDGYLYISNGTDYKLISHICPESYPSVGQPFYDPSRPTWAWQISTPNAINW